MTQPIHLIGSTYAAEVPEGATGFFFDGQVPMGIVECKIVEYDGGIKGTRFVNYLNDNQRTWYINKTDSFRSLIISKGLDPVKNYILIKKLK